jgi:AGCS family alanine or glycine:cation symporter
MAESLFTILELFENYLWQFIGAPLVLILGLYLTFYSKFFQLRNFPGIIRAFIHFFKGNGAALRGVHPLKAFFAGIGGCVGIGNIAAICTAVQIGGPGALFWIWITALMGMLVKYSEVYLGLKYRVPNVSGGYNGGPMYFLQKVFKRRFIPNLVSFLLCIYGVEVYQFSVVTHNVAANLSISPFFVALGLSSLVLFAASGGVKRIGVISAALIPIFVVLYVGMGLWILVTHIESIPSVIREVFVSAFSGAAPFGGFVGSSLLMTLSHAIRRGCYTADVGAGCASVIHSESGAHSFSAQASLVIVEIFVDTFVICTTSIFMILVTDVWHQQIEASAMIQAVLSQYFPFMDFFIPLFLLLLGYSTMNTYFCVGLKCADSLGGRRGKWMYYGYSMMALPLFSFIGIKGAQSLMAISGGLLLMINCYGIFRLRKEVSFDLQMSKDLQKDFPIAQS